MKTLRLCVAAATALSCTYAIESSAKDKTPSVAPPPSFGWRLPKTVLDVTATYVATDCQMVKGYGPDGKPGPDVPNVVFTAKVDIVARAVADENLGPQFKNGLVTIDRETKGSFWVDKSISYGIYPGKGGILQSLSSHPAGQGGTIISNILSGIVKIASAGIIAGPKAPPQKNPEQCGTKLQQAVARIKALQATLPMASVKDRESIAATIQALKDSITITVKKTIDAGRDEDGNLVPVASASDQPAARPEWRVGFLAPKDTQYVKAGWYEAGSAASGSAHPDQYISIYLDFDGAALLDPRVCTTSDPAKPVAPVAADKPLDPNAAPQPAGGAAAPIRICAPPPMASNAQFRQAAYVRVYAKKGAIATLQWPTNTLVATGDDQTVAFGQFGVGRGIPLTTGAFKDVSWAIEFSELGEITKSSFAKKATGASITGAFASGAGSLETAAGLPGKAASQLDTDTLRLQAENALLKAQIDNKTYKQQLEAAGQPADDPK